MDIIVSSRSMYPIVNSLLKYRVSLEKDIHKRLDMWKAPWCSGTASALKDNNINDRATEKKIACIYNGIIINNKKTWKKHNWIQNCIIFIIEAALASAGVGICWWLVQPHASRSSSLTHSVCQPLSLTRSSRIPNACSWAFLSVRHLAAKARNRISKPAMALWGYVLVCRSWLIGQM